MDLTQQTEKPYIVLVDDEIDILEVLVENMKDKFTIDTAKNAEEVINYLGNIKSFVPDYKLPEVVLTDRKMPGMDGIQLIKTLKENYPGVRLFLMTADTGYDIEAKAAGAEDCFRKPFDTDILINKIMQAATESRYKQ